MSATKTNLAPEESPSGQHEARWRWSLLFGALLVAPALSGCLIAPPDEVDQQEQVAPRIDMQSVSPTPFAYFETRSDGVDPPFTAAFVSEDLGEKVVGKLYINLDADGEDLVGSAEVGAATLDDPPRSMTVPWEIRRERSAGCYVFTMTITHASNYDDEVVSKPIDISKTAYITWWVVHDQAADALTFDRCPQPVPEP